MAAAISILAGKHECNTSTYQTPMNKTYTVFISSGLSWVPGLKKKKVAVMTEAATCVCAIMCVCGLLLFN